MHCSVWCVYDVDVDVYIYSGISIMNKLNLVTIVTVAEVITFIACAW